jgi:hypothetical protein
VAHPFELAYNWQTRACFASIAAAICVGVLARTRVTGWLSALVVVVALWALVVGLIYLRAKAYLLVDGSRLTVRRFRKFHTIEAADLVAVAEFLTPHGRVTGSPYELRTDEPHLSLLRLRCSAAAIPPSSRGYWDGHLRRSSTRARAEPRTAEDPRTDPMIGARLERWHGPAAA